MKNTIIAVLFAVIAIGGALSGFAASRTVETTVDVEMQFWVDTGSNSVFVSTVQEGEEWITHDFRVPLKEVPRGIQDPVLVSEPVTTVGAGKGGGGSGGPAALLTPREAGAPQFPPGKSALGEGVVLRGAGNAGQRARRNWRSGGSCARLIAYARHEPGAEARGIGSR